MSNRFRTNGQIGTGYLSRRMAPAVMPGGMVWSVDVQQEMISPLQAGGLYCETAALAACGGVP